MKRTHAPSLQRRSLAVVSLSMFLSGCDAKGAPPEPAGGAGVDRKAEAKAPVAQTLQATLRAQIVMAGKAQDLKRARELIDYAMKDPGATHEDQRKLKFMLEAVEAQEKALQEIEKPATPAAEKRPATPPPPIGPGALERLAAEGSKRTLMIRTLTAALNGDVAQLPLLLEQVDKESLTDADRAALGKVRAAAGLPAPDYFNIAYEKAEKGDFDGAIVDYSEALRLDSKNAAAYNNRGKAKQHKGDFDGAISDYSEALRLDPKHVYAYNNRGNAKKAKGDFDGAIADYTEALSLDPKHPFAYNSRGIAKQGKGDLDGAIADYSEALRLDPKNAAAYNNRGNVKGDKGDFDGAISDYSEALRFDPKDVNAYLNRGITKRDKGDFDGAISDFTETLRLDPKHVNAYFNRGLAKYAKDDFDGAIADYSEALRLNPNHVRAYHCRGVAKWAKDDFDGGIADYSEALRLDPKDVNAYHARGLAKQAKHDLDGAIADYGEALGLDPKYVHAYERRGLAKHTKGDFEGAMADFRKSLALLRNSKNDQEGRDYQALYIWSCLERLSRRAEGDKELARHLDEHWKGSPDDWPVKLAEHLLGRVSVKDLFAVATDPDPEKDRGRKCQAWYYAGIKRLADGDKEGAISHLRRCLATDMKTFMEYTMAKALLKQLGQ